MTDDRGAAWGNGWGNVPPATVPGLEERRGLVSVGSFPWRKVGARTPVMVRSVLHCGDTEHVILELKLGSRNPLD